MTVSECDKILERMDRIEQAMDRIGGIVEIVAQNQNVLAEQSNKLATYLLDHAVQEKKSIPAIKDIVASGPDTSVLPTAAKVPEKRLEEIRGEGS